MNPQLGEGKIAATGTVARTSKFGLCVKEQHEALLEYYKAHPWLTALHVHTGSQGCSLELLVDSCRFIAELRKQINKHAGRTQVIVLDIGGGLPANYDTDSDAGMRISPREYANALRKEVPALFREGVQLVTEFGRHINTKAGVFLSRVEYTKTAGDRHIAVQHVGADYMLRECYQPKVWRHRVSAWSATGKPLLQQDTAVFDVVGPLCFRGDIIANKVDLPKQLSQGDHVVIHDVGSYTLSMFSKYNSRQMCACYAYDAATQSPESFVLTKITDQESMDEVIKSWRMPAAAKQSHTSDSDSRKNGVAKLIIACVIGCCIGYTVSVLRK